MLVLLYLLHVLVLPLKVKDPNSLTLLNVSGIFMELLDPLLGDVLDALGSLLKGLPFTHFILFSQVAAIMVFQGIS